jgi:hypothetical protein
MTKQKEESFYKVNRIYEHTYDQLYFFTNEDQFMYW